MSAEGDDQGDEFSLPLPDGEPEVPRLRRRLLGVKADDVREELASRDATITELRRDVAALWLAFSQHERTIRELTDAIEDLGGEPVAPPGSGEPDRDDIDPRRGVELEEPAGDRDEGLDDEPEPDGEAQDRAAANGAAPQGEIAEQLTGLDEVLAAIQRATASLERAYQEEIEESAKEDRP